MIIVRGNGDTYQGHGIGHLSYHDLERLDAFSLAQVILSEFFKPFLSLVGGQAVQGISVELLSKLLVRKGMRWA